MIIHSIRFMVLFLGFALAQPALALPDLQFDGIPAFPTVAVRGGTVTVSGLRIENHGTGFGTRSSPCQVGHFLRDGSGSTLLGTTDVPSLNSPGGITFPPFSLDIPASQPVGTYFFEIQIDYLDEVNESDETNNGYLRPIDIVVGVDLAFATQPVWGASIVLDGQSVDVSSFEIDDLTAIGFAGAFRVGHYLTTDPVGLSQLTRIGGPTLTVGPGDFPVTVPAATIPIPAGTAPGPGPWYFVTLLDDIGLVPEDSEANNVSDATQVTLAVVTWTSAFTTVIGGATGGGGVAWGDYDNDGDHDLFLARDGLVFSGKDVLLRNDGVAGWAPSPVPFFNSGNGAGVVWADLDDDGWLDLYVTRGPASPEPNTYFHNEAGTEFQDYTNVWPGLGDPGYSTSATVIDFDADGDLDTYVSNLQCSSCVSSADHLLRNDQSVFQSVNDPDLEYPDCTQASAWADFDRDGDADVFVTGVTAPEGSSSPCSGQNRLLRNDGGGSFTPFGSSYFRNSRSHRGCAWGDYDNDGDLDLFVAGQNRSFLYRNEGGVTFADVSAFALGDAFDGTSVCWLDFDLDGDLDLFLGASTNASNRLLRNEGTGWFAEVTLAPLVSFAACIGAAVADYDDDGDPDIYVSNGQSSDRLYRNDLSSGNHWLQVDLRGTVSNSFGVGALVEITAGGVTQMRQVEGGSGWLSQNSLTVEFGVGTLTQIDRLVIHWPSGIVQDFTQGIGIDRRITIHESDSGATATPPESMSSVVNLHAPSPNPFNPRTVLRFEIPKDDVVSLTVFDATGRRVRSLMTNESLSAGLHSMTWDGRDDLGKSVASGMYLYRLETPSGNRTQKAVLVR